MGKGGPCCFRRTSGRRRLKKAAESPSRPAASSPPQDEVNRNRGDDVSAIASAGAGGGAAVAASGGGKGKKKAGGGRMWLWTRFDRAGRSELLECEKSAIVRRVSIPARDLRILGPVFSHSSNILGTSYRLFSFFSFSGLQRLTAPIGNDLWFCSFMISARIML